MRYMCLGLVLVAVAAGLIFGTDGATAGDMVLMGMTAAAPALTTEQQLTQVSSELVRVSNQLKEYGERAAKELEQNGKLTNLTKDAVDKLLVENTTLRGRLDDIEQKMVREAGNDNKAPKTPGFQVIENQNVIDFMTKKPKSSHVQVEVKNVVTSAASSAGVLVDPQRIPGIISPPDRRLTVRDLITPGRTTSNSLEYLQETGFTNNAAVVSEGAQKPESNITFDLVTSPVRTIAHWVHATRQILDDAPQLQSYIDGRLRYGLAYVEETELLRGSGTGQHLHGIIPQATAYAAAFAVASETEIDVLRLAMLQAELAEFPATGMVLHPTDWARIELTKTTTGEYVWSNPRQLASPSLWGLPIVTTQAMFVDEFLVGAFRLGAQVFDREDANVLISTEDRDNFIKNMVTILAEERLALNVYRPEAFVTGDFGNVT